MTSHQAPVDGSDDKKKRETLLTFPSFSFALRSGDYTPQTLL
jgi:hypothetical protein